MHPAAPALPEFPPQPPALPQRAYSQQSPSQPASPSQPDPVARVAAAPGPAHAEAGGGQPHTARRAPLNLRGSPVRRALLAVLVAGVHLAGLATLAHLGSRQPSAPEIVPIQVALLEAAPAARPAAEPPPVPASAPTPAPTAPPPPEVRRPEPPPPPRPAPSKPAPRPQAKPAVKAPTPVTESPTALRAPAEAAAAAAPEAPPAAPAPPAPTAAAAPAAPAAVALTEARFDAAYLNNPRPAYPMLSRRLREEGQVMLRVLVSADGQASRVELRTSSGSERLDRAAQEAVARWRFVPARRGEVAVEAWVLVPIVFKLQGN